MRYNRSRVKATISTLISIYGSLYISVCNTYKTYYTGFKNQSVYSQNVFNAVFVPGPCLFWVCHTRKCLGEVIGNNIIMNWVNCHLLVDVLLATLILHQVVPGDIAYLYSKSSSYIRHIISSNQITYYEKLYMRPFTVPDIRYFCRSLPEKSNPSVT